MKDKDGDKKVLTDEEFDALLDEYWALGLSMPIGFPLDGKNPESVRKLKKAVATKKRVRVKYEKGVIY